MIDKDFLCKLFELYLNHEEILRRNSNKVKSLLCYHKYKKSLPPEYIFSFPNQLILKLTEACNLRCKHCFYAENPNYYNKKSEFSTSEIKKLIDFFVDEINVLFITLTGGEVFVRDDFLEILEYIKRKFLPVTIQTNGLLIDEKKAFILSQLLNPKTDYVQISLDGADKNSHEAIRGTGTFEKTINTIRHLKKCNIRVQINTTLTSVNAPKMEHIFELCDNLNVNMLSISKFELCSEQQRYLKLSADKLMEYSSVILAKSRNFRNIRMNYKPLSIYDFLQYTEGRTLIENYIQKNNLKKCRTNV